MRYILACLQCGAIIMRTDHVRDAEIAAVESHLRSDHPDLLPAERHMDFAEVLGHVRVKMSD